MAGLGAAREAVAKVFSEHLPRGWRLISDEALPDTLDRTTVFLSITNVARHPAAPLGAWDTTVQVTLASPKWDNLPAAESDLERDLGELLGVIEDHLATAWDPAEKRQYAGRYLCWDINLHVSTTRVTPERKG